MNTLYSAVTCSRKLKSSPYLLILFLILCMSSGTLFGQDQKYDQSDFLPQKLEQAKSIEEGKQLQLTKSEVQYIDNNRKGLSVEIDIVKKDLKKAKLFQDADNVGVLEKKLEVLRKMAKDYDFVKLKSTKEI